jgi:hypothetical protein
VGGSYGHRQPPWCNFSSILRSRQWLFYAQFLSVRQVVIREKFPLFLKLHHPTCPSMELALQMQMILEQVVISNTLRNSAVDRSGIQKRNLQDNPGARFIGVAMDGT